MTQKTREQELKEKIREYDKQRRGFRKAGDEPELYDWDDYWLCKRELKGIAEGKKIRENEILKIIIDLKKKYNPVCHSDYSDKRNKCGCDLCLLCKKIKEEQGEK